MPMTIRGKKGDRRIRTIDMLRGFAALALVATLSCGEGATEPPQPDPPRPTTVTVTPAAVELSALGATRQMTAEVRDQNGQPMAGAAVSWSSSDAAVATVDAQGLVTAAGNGMATVTATAGAASGSTTVTVRQVVSTVAVSPPADTLIEGDTLRLEAVAADANGHAVAGTAFAWASSDTLVARVDGAGLVSGVAAGESEVTAATDGVTGRAELVVAAPAPTTVAVTPEAPELAALGQEVQLTAEVRDQIGRVMTDITVSWSSGDTTVAKVDSAGLVTAVGMGVTLVTATARDASGAAAVTVMQSAGSVTVSPPADTIAPGDTLRLAAEAFDTNGHAVAGAAFTWSSSDASVARVDGSGLVRGDAEGTATITAMSGSAQGTSQITVVNPDRAALATLYEATSGPDWVNNDNWLTDAPLGDWHGIDVDEAGRVERIYLSFNNLEGEIPPELGSLTKLRSLVLYVSRIEGEIPPQLGNLTELHLLNLSWSSIEGEVPPELGNLAELRQLFLNRTALTGALPQSLLGLRQLTDVRLNRALCVSGTIAFLEWIEEIDNLERGPFCNEADIAVLESLYGSAGGTNWTNADGWLDGVVLDRWHGVAADSLGRVEELDLSRNGLAGQLPAVLGNLDRMTSLRVGGNALSGRLPLGLAHLSLRELHYSGTELCAPSGEEFRTWLNAIPSHEGTSGECEPMSDRDFLALLYDATGGPGWKRSDTWLTDAPLGDWHGIEVDDAGRVVAIDLTYNDLVGRIPPELGDLTELRSLALGSNDLSGEIPPELGNLTQLVSVRLLGSNLSGEIPDELGNLTQLNSLNLGYNDLSGEIPDELGNLTQLNFLNLGYNDLSGEIPDELGNLTQLNSLNLGYNDLVGRIPPELGDLTELRSLALGSNDLSGEIPPELGNLTQLRYLRWSDNNLSGEIPDELGRLGGLRIIELGNNMFSGQVPPALGDLAALEVLHLFGNADLSGPLPERLLSLKLSELMAGGTALCAPDEPAFRAWLASIAKSYVPHCGGGGEAYLTQAAQSRKYPVPLVAGESALLRVFVTSGRDTGETIPPVQATFFVNGAEAHVADIPADPSTIPTEADEGELGLSVNAEIPGEVIQPGLEMVVEIDPGRTLDSSLGVGKRIPAEGRAAVDVRILPTFNLTLIPFVHTPTDDRRAVGLVEELHPNHELLWMTNYLLPVGDFEITKHEPVMIDSNSGYDLLAETERIRTLEAGTGHWTGVSYGVTDVGGVAKLRGKVSFSGPNEATIAHEFGHNFSLVHAPCGTRGDPLFPHRGGRIGVWGYDPRDGGSLVPTDNPELMSYCYPRWISDYFFKNALLFRIADEGEPPAAPIPTRTLLVSGRIDADSTLHLDPAFVVESTPVAPSTGGPYALTGRRSDESELFSFTFDMREVADGDGRSTFLFALPARAEWESELASLVLSGPDGAVEMSDGSEPPMAIVRDPRTGQVRAVLRDLPDLPVGTLTRSDLDALAPEPGLEVMVSRGLPDAGAWRR